MIVKLVDKNSDYSFHQPPNVIVLEVTEKDIKRGTQAEKPGLYGFRGLWYKGNGTTIKSYGKIFDLSAYDEDEIFLVRDNIWNLSKQELKEFLNVYY